MPVEVSDSESAAYISEASIPPTGLILSVSDATSNLDSCAPTISQDSTALFTKEEYQSLASQCSHYVTVSTFSLALIFAFLAFLQGLGNMDIGAKHASDLQLHVATVSSYMSTVLHLSIVIVGGRATILCFRMSAFHDNIKGASPSKMFPESMKAVLKVDFTVYVSLFGYLSSFGTICVIVAMLCVITYFMSPIALAILGLLTLYLLIIVFHMGFWRISGLEEIWVLIPFKLGTTPTEGARRDRHDRRASRFQSIVTLRENVGRIFRRRQHRTLEDVEQNPIAMESLDSLQLS